MLGGKRLVRDTCHLLSVHLDSVLANVSESLVRSTVGVRRIGLVWFRSYLVHRRAKLGRVGRNNG